MALTTSGGVQTNINGNERTENGRINGDNPMTKRGRIAATVIHNCFACTNAI